MEYRWVGKRIDFVLLGEYIQAFFRNRGFTVRKEEMPDGFNVTVGQSGASGEGKSFVSFVKVVGQPQDFVVEFGIEDASRASRIFDSLAALIGGGRFVLRRLKSEDKLKELERDFWTYIGEKLALF